MSPNPMFELKHPPQDASSDDEVLRLSCTRGQPAPPGLPQDTLTLLGLPQAVKDSFFDVLAPYLAGEPSEQDQRSLQKVCEDNELDPQRLVTPIKAARFLISEAARTAQSPETFSEDIARLHDDPRSIKELIGILLPCYEKAAPFIRQQIITRTMSEHGKLTENIHWRVDKVINSEHGDGINTAVAVLTFDYREGAKQERITLHLLPNELARLKAACLQMMPEEAP